MKELRAIIGLLVILVGAFVLYKVWPVYWSDFKLRAMLGDQAIKYTWDKKTDEEIQAEVAEKANGLGVALTPSQIQIEHGAGDLSISTEYTVHIDVPIYPFDLNFKSMSKNHDIMK